jgi:hypothetical protein
MADLSTFEQECIGLIRKLEAVNLRKAVLRLEAATRAVQRAHEEIEAFKTTLQVYRDVHVPPSEQARREGAEG